MVMVLARTAVLHTIVPASKLFENTPGNVMKAFGGDCHHDNHPGKQ